MQQLDFENQVADEISLFCATALKPIVSDVDYIVDLKNESLITPIIESISSKSRLLNPYIKEVQFALDYFLYVDEITKINRERFVNFFINNYHNHKVMDDYLKNNNHNLEQFEFEDMYEIICIDYNDLTKIVHEKFNKLI